MRPVGLLGLPLLAALAVAGASPAAPRSCPPGLGAGGFAWTSGGKLRVLDLATCGTRTLVARDALGASFSADGEFVAYDDGVVAVASGRVYRGLRGTWAPRGHTLADTTNGGGLVLHGPDVPARTLLPDGWGAGSIAWAPSGEFLALTRSRNNGTRNEIWLYHLATGDTQLVAGPFPIERVPVLAAVSPGADWVVWWAYDDHAVSANNDGVPLMAKRIAGGARGPQIAPRVLAAPELLTWCGRRLLVAAGLDRYTTHGKRLLSSAPPLWRSRNISRDPSRSWTSPACSSDGRRLAVSAGRNWVPPRFGLERRSIWTMSVEGKQRRRLTAPPPQRTDELPRWTSGGRSVIFVRTGPTKRDLSARGVLYVVGLDGRPARRILDLGLTGNYYGRYGWAATTDLTLRRPASR